MKIIQVPFCFYPDPVGGTEVYVEGLCRQLRTNEVEVVVAAPAKQSSSYYHDSGLVRRFGVREELGDLRELYGEGDEKAAAEFGNILDEERPDIVHLHAFTRGVSLRVVRTAKDRKIPVLFTYHTPTVSCQRGTMMRWGVEPCDGLMDLRSCTRCTLHGLGLNRLAAFAVGTLPPAFGTRLGRAGRRGGIWTALRLSELVALRHTTTRALLAEVDHIVAVCDWVRQVLLRNGVPEQKITLCRQGVVENGEGGRQKAEPEKQLPTFQIAFFGRLDATKGVDILFQALRSMPHVPLRLDIYGVAQGEAGRQYEQRLRQLASGDDRIEFRQPVSADAVVATLTQYDVLAVPSQWLETGPLVVLEAFAAGVPVIGSRLGGIAELVEDGVDGLLVNAHSVADWAEALSKLANDPVLLGRLRSSVRSPRTMADVAAEMVALYLRLRRKSQNAGVST